MRWKALPYSPWGTVDKEDHSCWAWDLDFMNVTRLPHPQWQKSGFFLLLAGLNMD